MFSKKMILIHLFFAMISSAILYHGMQGRYLIWNMFLALAALDFAFLSSKSKNLTIQIIAALLWLFFYPNTFYMITDIVHMSFVKTVLWEQSSMILFMLFVPSILFGVMSGVESLRMIFSGFKVNSYWLRLFLIACLSLLSSVAIHIGRYARLNSWDIFTRPLHVIQEMLAAISWQAMPFILGFTFIQIMVLIFSEQEK